MDKALCYIQKIDEETAFIDRVKKEIDRLTKMKKSSESLVSRLKLNLVDSVNVFGEYDTGLYKVGVRVSKAVNIMDEGSIPNEFKTTESNVKIDKTAIKKAIGVGEIVEGAVIVENKSLSLGKPKK